jgi:hypothetical protein
VLDPRIVLLCLTVLADPRILLANNEASDAVGYKKYVRYNYVLQNVKAAERGKKFARSNNEFSVARILELISVA